MDELDKAIKLAGGQYALAEKIGRRQSVISMAKNRGYVSPILALLIASAFPKGKVKAKKLCPDLDVSTPVSKNS